MSHAQQLWLFFVVVFGVVVLPGLDMAYVLASSLVGGRGAGLAAVGGIIAGGVVHTTLGALGIATVLALWPAAFNAMLIAGAAYMAWIGWAILRGGAALRVDTNAPRRARGVVFAQAMLTCLSNPKAYVFMLAIFPQFLRPAEGVIARQALVLGAIIAFTQALVYGALALVAARARSGLQDRPERAVVIARVVGVALMLAAVATLWQGWRGAV